MFSSSHCVATVRATVQRTTRRSSFVPKTRSRCQQSRGLHSERIARSYGTPWTSSHYTVAAAMTACGVAGWCLGMHRTVRPTLAESPSSVSKAPHADITSTTPLDRSLKPQHDVSEANLRTAEERIVGVVGEANVDSRLDDIKLHTGSEWSSHPISPDEAPAAIVRPESTEQVSKIMKICHDLRIPVVAFSGGTSLEGHFANTRRGITIDLGRMNKILAAHKDDLDVVVQPGVGYEELNEALAQQELFFPPDPGPGAMIGGMISTGCSGTNAYRYGTMKNWVVSVTVVLADGTVIRTRQRPLKSSAGYDLTRLFIGGEGTLGVVTEAVLRVTTLPQNVRVAVASFPTIRAAAECVDKVVQKGIQVAAVELLDELAIKCINESGATDREWKEQPTLFFKFSGTENGVSEEIAVVQDMAKTVGNTGFVFAEDDQEAEDLWGARKTMLWGSSAIKKHDDDQVWITDVAVPMSRLPDMIELSRKDLATSGLPAMIVGHVGDGNFHAAMFYSQEERSIAEGVVHRMVERALEMEGTATGEHGVGLVKRDYLPRELGQSTVDAMRRIKQAFDPLCLLNCDKVIRAEPEQK